ncbi:MAG TPA: Xaa-Pro peptidase family protein [Dongiaceae bacterium]|nr:Xaa-Pro peptidase family protein [Dongiaceae bacterium]
MTAYAHSKVDRPSLRRYRLERIRRELRRGDYGGALLFDPPNLRYATDIPNMQVWALHNKCRYVYVPTEGPVILFDYGCARHLSAGDDLIAETRTAFPHTYFTNGGRHSEFIDKWAEEIADLVRQHGGGNRRLAVDKLDPVATHALEREGVVIADGEALMEWARAIKNADEIRAMKEAIAACEAGIEAMWRALKPGMTENEVWAHLHATNIAMGGEWIECRLLASGERTNPWFQECSNRVIQAGDIVAFDTDLIGPNGYCADISRAWVAGDAKPTDEQKRLYGVALDNLDHNLALVKAGLSFREFTEKSFPLPEAFVDRRYSCIMHGVGLCDEYPFAVYPQDWQRWGFDGQFEAGMTVCIEALIGAAGGKECVKLEQQVLVTETGYELLSHAPLGLRPEY